MKPSVAAQGPWDSGTHRPHRAVLGKVPGLGRVSLVER